MCVGGGAGTQYAWKAEQLFCPISGGEARRRSEEEKGALREQIEERGLKQKEGRDGEKVQLCFSHPLAPDPPCRALCRGRGPAGGTLGT